MTKKTKRSHGKSDRSKNEGLTKDDRALLKRESDKEKKAAKKERVSCASVARGLIKAGKTNAEVWEVIQKEFKLDDGKKSYPSWYRSEMKRSAR